MAAQGKGVRGGLHACQCALVHADKDALTIGSSEPMQNLHSRVYCEIILNFRIIIIIIFKTIKIINIIKI
jgi:hypothetical protein